MITKLRALTQKQSDKETGSDIVTTLFLIPLIVALLFTMIDVSTYFQTKTQVQNITRDGARTVALLGGASAEISLNKEKFGGAGQSVATYVRNKLVSGDKCTISGCTTLPTVTCSPTVATSLNADATCTTVYYYQPVGGQLVEWLGFGSLVTTEIKSTETFKTETVW